MISWMLEQMERVPTSVFSQNDLEARFPHEFKAARTERLITRVALADDGLVYVESGRLLTVIQDGDKLQAFDDEDPDFDLIEVNPRLAVLWRLDILSVARRIRQANDLSASPERLDQRLLYLGEEPRQSSSIVLGLFHEHELAMRTMRQLPNLSSFLSSGRIVVVTPTFRPALSENAELRSLQVFVVSGGLDKDFHITMPDLANRELLQAKRATLTPLERDESVRHEFKSDLVIEVSGLRRSRGAYKVSVGGMEQNVSRQPFRLFLRLILELLRSPDGFLDMNELELREFMPDESITTPSELIPRGPAQDIDRLRQRFPEQLFGLHRNQFLERADNKVRISTHPACLSVNWTELLNSSDEVVQRIARAALLTNKSSCAD